MRGRQLGDLVAVLVDTLGGAAVVAIAGIAFSVIAAPLDQWPYRSERTRELAAGPTQSEPLATETIIVTGRIEAAKRNAEGLPMALRIVDSGGERYLIAADAKGKELLSHVGKLATVKGVLRREAVGPPLIAIESYRVEES